jgi:hypothetical protein
MDSWDSWSHYRNRPITLEENLLYVHLQESVSAEPPEQVIERFWKLFIDGLGYPDPYIWRSLTKIINDQPDIEREFKFILNRCCYTLINPWQLQHQHEAIPELIALFEMLPIEPGHAPTTRRIRELVQQFTHTEQYAALRRLPQLLSERHGENNQEDNQPLGTLLSRYPYLYEYCLLTKDSDEIHQSNIHQLKKQVQRQFETDLARYDNYRSGRSHLEPAQNPTLLSNSDLDTALDYYMGKSSGQGSHRDIAKRFLTHSKLTRSYREFKEELGYYLIDPIIRAQPKYADQFNRQLRQYLKNTLSDSDSHRLNDSLLIGTCRKLLNFLVVDTLHYPLHHTFIDLLGNVGYTLTIGLLLRIILLCRMVKPWLEKRFAILFNLHEAHQRDDVRWLITALEHVNIALSTNFGVFSFR